jgi:SDR family mycofactocin-dependent oxidoreductase
MTTALEGKVALITGAARGQGRSHAVRLAEMGADIIAVDICEQIGSVRYPMATPEELEETAALVRALGRRIVARKADIRDYEGLRSAVDEGVAELGGLDFVIANAGIAAFGDGEPHAQFRDTIEVNLVGTWHTLEVSAPHLRQRGSGSIVLISSSAVGGRTSELAAGSRAYVASKSAMLGLMRNYALDLGRLGIRVNAILPCGVDTPMINFDAGRSIHEKAESLPWQLSNVIPVPFIQSADISDAVAWLVSDAARYVTGVVLPVDAGFSLT